MTYSALLLALSLCHLLDRGHCDDSLVRLYRTLLRSYENEVRPAMRHDHPVNVTFSFALTQIIDVDERKEIMTTNAWIRQSWIDYKLIWNPLDFDNLTTIHIPHNKIWKPDIILYNNAASAYDKSVMSTDVIVSFDGNVSWTMAGIFQSSCGMDVRYYPFDSQSCILKFASWAYDGTKIDILLSSDLGDESNYMTSTEWHLKSIRAEKNSIIYSCCPEPYPFVDIFITIQRRPMFYVFNLILPCVMISGIALLGFYMPSGAGEKVSLGITSLLSTTVFLMLVAEGMPPTSDALPLLGIYYGATIFVVSLATAMTVLTLNVHHHGATGGTVPALVQRVVLGYVARALLMRPDFYHGINEHVAYFYAKENGADAAEDRLCSMWLRAANANSTTNNEADAKSRQRLGARQSAPALVARAHRDATLRARTPRPPNVGVPTQKRVSWSQDTPTPDCNGQLAEHAPWSYRGRPRHTPNGTLPHNGSARRAELDGLLRGLPQTPLGSAWEPNHRNGGVDRNHHTDRSELQRDMDEVYDNVPLPLQHANSTDGNRGARSAASDAQAADGTQDARNAANHATDVGNAKSHPNGSRVMQDARNAANHANDDAPFGDNNPADHAPEEARRGLSGTTHLLAAKFIQLKRARSCSPAQPRRDAADPEEDLFENEFLRVLARVHGAIERNEMRQAEKDRRNATRLEWEQVALVLDRFLFILFAAGTTLTSLIIIYQRQLWAFLGYEQF